MKSASVLSAVVAVFAAGSAFAGGHQTTLGDLTLSDPIVRATPPGAPVSAGYLTIENAGDQDERLVAVTAPFANVAEVHEMAMVGEVMQMRELGEGIVIPAGESVTLEPGGLHLMFLQLNDSLAEGEERAATLTFETAGDVELTFTVQKITPKSMKKMGDNASAGSASKATSNAGGSGTKASSTGSASKNN